MKRSLIKLGTAVKKIRKERGLTLQVLAERTELTAGLLSKIENFRTVPSLPVLLKIAEALEIPAAELVKEIDAENLRSPWALIRAADRRKVDREDSTGFVYENLTETAVTNSKQQVMLVTVQPNAQREMVSTEGYEFIFILSGKLVFHLGENAIALDEGDLLFFDGTLPHVPENKTDKPATLLAIYLLKED